MVQQAYLKKNAIFGGYIEIFGHILPKGGLGLTCFGGAMTFSIKKINKTRYSA